MWPFRIGEQPRELDREEGIAGGGIVDAAQRGPRDRNGQVLAKDRAERSKRQGSEPHHQPVITGVANGERRVLAVPSRCASRTPTRSVDSRRTT